MVDKAETYMCTYTRCKCFSVTTLGQTWVHAAVFSSFVTTRIVLVSPLGFSEFPLPPPATYFLNGSAPASMRGGAVSLRPVGIALWPGSVPTGTRTPFSLPAPTHFQSTDISASPTPQAVHTRGQVLLSQSASPPAISAS